VEDILQLVAGGASTGHDEQGRTAFINCTGGSDIDRVSLEVWDNLQPENTSLLLFSILGFLRL
jgi:hypothetical protein